MAAMGGTDAISARCSASAISWCPIVKDTGRTAAIVYGKNTARTASRASIAAGDTGPIWAAVYKWGRICSDTVAATNGAGIYNRSRGRSSTGNASSSKHPFYARAAGTTDCRISLSFRVGAADSTLDPATQPFASAFSSSKSKRGTEGTCNARPAR